MFGLILASSVVLGYVLGLNLWQGVVVTLFCACVYLTGRRVEDGL